MKSPDKPVSHAVTLTHVGHRTGNEDAEVLVFGHDVGRDVKDLLFGVVDGMGGRAAGEVAAAIVRDVVTAGFSVGEDDVAGWIVRAHEAVLEDTAQHQEHMGMGAVVSLGLIIGRELTIGHVGDTRIYRLRAGTLEQLSEDQSITGELVRAGQLEKESARTHPRNNVVTQAVGQSSGTPVPSTYRFQTEPDDVYLACSDGLTDVITDAQIVCILDDTSDLVYMAQRLIDAALTDQIAVDAEGRRVPISGGRDNITVAIVSITA